MSLTLSQQPGFTETLSSAFAAGSPVTDSTMNALNSAVNFAAVRNEQFYGYYANGDTVKLPVSLADGYQYSREELLYSWSWYATCPPAGAAGGTQTPPALAHTGGSGTVLYMTAKVDQSTGAVATDVEYYQSGGSQNHSTDGILMVITHAQRNR